VRAPGAAYGDDVRARVLADLAAGESVSAVARTHGLTRATVLKWRALSTPQQQPLDPDFRALVLHYLQESLEAGERILGQTRDPQWLGRQNAGDLAVFMGVAFDKAARILAALPADAPPGEQRRLPPGDGA